MKDITVFTEKPCDDAADWLETQTSLASAWENCERSDWLWWALQHMDGKMPTKDQSARYARWCAERARATADAARATADAAYAARVTAAAAYASADAAYYAARDVYYADYADYAADAAEAAADYAADAAEAAADYAASATERHAQAEWIRANISNPFKE